MTEEPITFGPLLRHLRQIAGVTRDEAAEFVQMDGRKYSEIEGSKREWPGTPEGIKSFRDFMQRLDAVRYIVPLWMIRMRRRKNFPYRFNEVPPSYQETLCVWELFERHTPGAFPAEKDNLSEFVREIKSLPPKLIPDNE